MTFPPSVVRQLVDKSCREQGLPLRITEPLVLRQVADLVGEVDGGRRRHAEAPPEIGQRVRGGRATKQRGKTRRRKGGLFLKASGQ